MSVISGAGGVAMASAYENAMAEKQQLEIQQQQINGRLAEIETFLRLHRQFEAKLDVVGEGRATLGPITASGYGFVTRTPVSDIEGRKGVTQKEFEVHLSAILSDASRPLKFSEIKEKLADRNVPIGGANKDKNLSTKLWHAANKSDEFIKFPGQKYWFTDREIPQSELESIAAAILADDGE
jgi:hypothetical protein